MTMNSVLVGQIRRRSGTKPQLEKRSRLDVTFMAVPTFTPFSGPLYGSMRKDIKSSFQ